MEKVSIVDIAKIILKKWWLFAIVIVAAAVLSFFYTTFLVQPVYVSSGSVYITNADANNTQSGVNLSDVMLAQELTSTYSEILSSNTFLKQVSKESGLNYSYLQLKKMISYTQKEGVPVLEVQAAAFDPKEACIIAETIINGAQGEVSRIIKGGIVSVIDHAEVPVAPASPSLPKNMAIAVLLAIVVVGIIVFCVEFFDDRVKSSTELSAYGLPVLAEIPYMLNDEEKEKISKKKKKVKTA